MVAQRSEWALTQFATAKAGLVLVNVNPAYLRTELEYAMNKVECKALILAPASKPPTTRKSPPTGEGGQLPHRWHVVRLGPERRGC